MSFIKARSFSQLPWYSSSARLLRLVTALMIIVLLSVPHQTSIAQTGWQWYKTDLHVHSVISADAYTDLGIISQSAKSQGYSALFLTDHNLASSFPISSLTANNMVFDESFTRWTRGQYGSPSSTINVLTSARANSGVNSLQLSSTATGSGETYVWTTRGPNFRSGDIILKVSVYPTRIDSGSGVYISASIGGDVTVQKADGYTTSSGVISSGKSVVFVWQLGSARAPSTNTNARVLTYPLAYTLNTWNHYTINVSDYLANIPAAERPLDYNGLTYLKMAAAGNGGTASAYFDTYSIAPTAPVAAADEFVYRTSVISNFDTSTFKIFPSLEMGVSKHAQRLNFGITQPSQFLSYWNGIDGILPAQQSGYPSMLNHPGSSGGVSSQEAISTQGYGADLIEVRQQTWLNNWDGILQQGVQVMGAGTSDTHRVFSGSSFATYVYAPSLTFDSLIRSIFEGRTYIAVGSFGNQGRVIFNKDSSSQEPYPARYPVYVPSTQTSANAHLSVTAGLGSGYTVKWLRNGTLLETDNATGTSYEATKSISLAGSWTYVRAEVRDSSGEIKALSQPIAFVPVSNLPADKSFYIHSINTADGRKYTKYFIKGITQSVWNTTSQALTLTLNNPANALVDMRVSTNQAPQAVQVNGGTIPSTGSLTTFQAASTSMWYYNSTSRLLYLKALQPTDTSTVSIGFGSTGPTATFTPTFTPTRTPTSTITPTPSGPMSTFTPIADAYVKAANPATNYGTSTTLRTDNSPITRSYLRFNVQGLSSPVQRATLRIFANTASNSGYLVNSLADNTWAEPMINYNNSPSPGGQIGSSGTVTTGTWTTVDVTSYITGNGTFNFALTGGSATEISLASRESGANAPQLIIEMGSGPANTPTTSPTLGTTATSTNTPVVTSTPTATAAASNTSTPTFTATPTLVANTSTFNPVADTYVNESSPISNYGSLTTLRADGSPIVNSYLRFDVQGLAGTVTRATLRIFTNSSSSSGYEVRNVADGSWDEVILNYSNAPAFDGVTGTSGPFGTGTWTTVDVTPLINGNGVFNMALTTTNNTAFSLASRESGANAPQLIIETLP
jgi:hypothetical protein